MKSGNEQAFTELFLRHSPRIYRLLFHLLGTHDEAEDIVQETFLTLYTSSPVIQEDRELLAWLSRVAMHRGYNVLRHKRLVSQKQEEIVRYHFPEEAQDTQQTVAEQERIQIALVNLRPRQSFLLLLRYSGYSYKEMADILSINASSIGTLLLRAEKSFIQQYEEEVIKQCAMQQLLRSYLDNSLPEKDQLAVTLHLLHCQHCQQYLRELQTLKTQVAARLQVPTPTRETFQSMIATLLTQIRQLKQSGRWIETVRLSQECLALSEVTAEEHCEAALCGADAYLHIGDDENARKLLQSCHRDQQQLPEGHPIHAEIQALNEALDETTPIGRMWNVIHGREAGWEKTRQRKEASEAVLASSSATLEQRCEAYLQLVTTTQDTQARQHILALLQQEATALPKEHRVWKALQFTRKFLNDTTPDGKIMASVRLSGSKKEESALRLLEEVLTMPDATPENRCHAYLQMIFVSMKRRDRVAVQQYIRELEQEGQKLPVDHRFHTEIADAPRFLDDKYWQEKPSSLVQERLYQGWKNLQESKHLEVVEDVTLLKNEQILSVAEQAECSLLLAGAYARLNRLTEAHTMLNSIDDVAIHLPIMSPWLLGRLKLSFELDADSPAGRIYHAHSFIRYQYWEKVRAILERVLSLEQLSDGLRAQAAFYLAMAVIQVKDRVAADTAIATFKHYTSEQFPADSERLERLYKRSISKLT